MIHEKWSSKVSLQFCSQVLYTFYTRWEAQKSLERELVDDGRILYFNSKKFKLLGKKVMVCNQVIFCNLAFDDVLTVKNFSLFRQNRERFGIYRVENFWSNRLTLIKVPNFIVLCWK